MSEEKVQEDKQEKADAGADKTKAEVKVPKEFQDLVKTIEGMSVLELSELVKVLEDKFGVSAAAPVAVVAAGPAAGGGEESTAEKSNFTVELTAAGDKKIAVIKAVRAVVSDLGLKDAKDLVDKAPATIKENVPKEEAEEMKKQLEEAGGTVELK